MMSDGSYRSQTPQQQQMPPQQYPQLQPQQVPPQPAQFQHQPPQQLMVNVQPQQSYPPHPVQQSQHHPTAVPQTTAPPPQSVSGPPITTANSNQPTSQDSNLHPFVRAKTLMVDLKQAIQGLMKTAADVAKETVTNEGNGGNPDTPSSAPSTTEDLRKSLDLFDAICNQIEANFILIQELHRHQSIGDRYTPGQILHAGSKPDEMPVEGGPARPLLTYKEYEDLTRLQTQFAASVRDSVLECCRLLD